MTQETALDILKTGANVFLTGEPGAGKTHTINQYIAWLRARGIEPAITASTGIAATHIGGMTVHSWSGIGIKQKLDAYELDRIASLERVVKQIRRTKILIIDEVSMLADNTLAMVDAVCREVLGSARPFGGLQVVLVGDFFQLPPIVRAAPQEEDNDLFVDESRTHFAYDAAVWARANPIVCYLTEQHRQDDHAYLSVLDAIRKNTFRDTHLEHIAARKVAPHKVPKNAPKLFSHNADVDRINDMTLRALPGTQKSFAMSSQGTAGIVAALVKSCISPEVLQLKKGASVMFTKNNPKEGYVNGTLGTVEGFSGYNGYPTVVTRSGRSIEVEPMEWTVEEGGKVHARVTQVPLRLAWAITVHKSQGMSLDEAVMDLHDTFEFGQGYVALSRVRRLSGLYILGWNKRTFEVHPGVLERDEQFRDQSEDAAHTFGAMPEGDLQKLHEQFLRACGGQL